VIELEVALRVLNNLVSIQTPCLRKTMNIGPKKQNGALPNSQLHQHTNKKISSTDFDTMTRLQSAQTATITSNSNYAERRNNGGFRGGMSEIPDTTSFNSMG